MKYTIYFMGKKGEMGRKLKECHTYSEACIWVEKKIAIYERLGIYKLELVGSFKANKGGAAWE